MPHAGHPAAIHRFFSLFTKDCSAAGNDAVGGAVGMLLFLLLLMDAAAGAAAAAAAAFSLLHEKQTGQGLQSKFRIKKAC